MIRLLTNHSQHKFMKNLKTWETWPFTSCLLMKLLSLRSRQQQYLQDELVLALYLGRSIKNLAIKQILSSCYSLGWYWMNEWAYHLSMISQSILRGTAHVLSVAKISTGAPKCFQLFSKPSTPQTSKRTLLLCCFSGTATPAGAHFLLQKQSSAAASLGSIKTPFVGQQYSLFSTTRSVSSKSLIFNSMADTTNTNNTEKKKVCIVGSGNW